MSCTLLDHASAALGALAVIVVVRIAELRVTAKKTKQWIVQEIPMFSSESQKGDASACYLLVSRKERVRCAVNLPSQGQPPQLQGIVCFHIGKLSNATSNHSRRQHCQANHPATVVAAALAASPREPETTAVP